GLLKEKPDMEALRKDFISFSISNKEVDKTIKEIYKKYSVMLEPHGAVGVAAVEKAKLNGAVDGLIVSLETAHPAKFPEKIKELLNLYPEVPESLKGLDDKEESFETINNDYDEFKERIKKNTNT
ncbi:threonine synthase, partial [Candidatus Woesearchaeota archaeon]|nr:threonine synthase [Candidatus Woesearchaeota archaeon]